MKKLLMLFVVVVGLLSAFFFGGTGAGPEIMANTVHAVSSGTAIYGINQAVMGAPGTKIYALDNHLWTFIWTLRDANGVAWVTVDSLKYDVLGNVLKNGATMANSATVKGIEQDLVQLGWRLKNATEVPESIKVGLRSGAEAAAIVGGRAGWLTRLVNIRPTFILVFEDLMWVNELLVPSREIY